LFFSSSFLFLLDTSFVFVGMFPYLPTPLSHVPDTGYAYML